MSQEIVTGARGLSRRAHRDLSNLKTTGSSWRTLNLIPVFERFGDAPAYRAQPFFRHPALNRSIIIKHRLRPFETDAFITERRVATKVILPINIKDLRAGGRTFFVGQRGFGGVCAEIGLKAEAYAADLEVLAVLDRLSGLDPFVMRERLKAAGLEPAACYFELNDADLRRMGEVARKEVEPLAGMAFGGGRLAYGEIVSRLATKLLRNAGDVELEPLRVSLGLEPTAFIEGVFAWKGFMYYKWALAEVREKIAVIADEIATARPARAPGDRERLIIASSRVVVCEGLRAVAAQVSALVSTYDAAYGEMTRKGRPAAFRDFLLTAPQLFNELGERMGVLQHVTSYWRYRMPEAGGARLSASELIDILADFSGGLKAVATLVRAAEPADVAA